MLDAIIDTLEDAIAKDGVAKVQPCAFVPSAAEWPRGYSRSDCIVEVLRVWMEHRWLAKLPVTVEDGLKQFADASLSERQLELLQFEEQRQRSLARNTQSHGGAKVVLPSLDELPALSSEWSGFRLMGVLGEGAFARVYLAKQVEMADRWVALKLTFRETPEAYWLSKLQHSAIVPIYSLHRQGAVHGICMPYLGNTTLADLLRELPRESSHGSGGRSGGRSSRRDSQWHGTALLETLKARQAQIETILSRASEVGVSGEVGSVAGGGLGSAGLSSASSDGNTSGGIASSPGGHVSGGQGTGSLGTGGQGTGGLGPAGDSVAVERMDSPLGHFDGQATVVWLGLHLAEALSHSHSKGILHSDIKPANILLASDGQPRLIDFNVSLQGSTPGAVLEGRQGSVLEAEGSTGNRVSGPAPVGGTIGYMAPEHRQAIQHHGEIDVRSDIYSLGVVLFELLTGQLPARLAPADRGTSERMQRWMRSHHPWISPALAAIVSHCLRPDPADRYGSAQQLAEDLRAQSTHHPLVHLQEPSWIERATKWRARHPRLASSGSIGLLASVLVLGLGYWIWIQGMALRQAEWKVHLDRLAQQLPTAIGLLSAKELAPQLEASAFEQMQVTARMLADGKGGAKLDPRWGTMRGEGEVDSLARDIDSFYQLAAQSRWSSMFAAGSRSGELESLQLETMYAAWKGSGWGSTALVGETGMSRALSAQGKGDWSEVRSRLEADPETVHHYAASWLLGDSCFALRDLQSAVEHYSICIALRPDVSLGYFNRGMVHFDMQRWDMAEKDYALACEREPALSWARFNRAIALQNLGRFEEACGQIDAAIEGGLDYVSAYRLRGELHGVLGRMERQQEDFQKAIATEIRCDQDGIDRGLLKLVSDPTGAERDFRKALEWNPGSLDARQKLAYVYAEILKDFPKAFEMLDELIRLAPHQPTHRAGRAVMYARGGQWAESAADLAACEAQQPTDPMVIYQMACGHALLASAYEKMEGEPRSKELLAFHGRQAQRRLAQTLAADRKLMATVMEDPDIDWLRRTAEFRTILETSQIAEGMATP